MLSMSDVMVIGRHKGQTVRDVMEKSPTYLMWWREEAKRKGQPDPFTPEVHKELNSIITNNKNVQFKFKTWPVSKEPKTTPKAKDNPFTSYARSYVEHMAREEAAQLANIEAAHKEEVIAHYNEEWGAW